MKSTGMMKKDIHPQTGLQNAVTSSAARTSAGQQKQRAASRDHWRIILNGAKQAISVPEQILRWEGL